MKVMAAAVLTRALTEENCNNVQALGWFTVFPWMRAVELLTAGIDTWHDGGEYTLLHCILWMFGDFFLYLFAAWYTDKVFPGEYGIKYPFYFLFSKNYWCPPPPLPAPPPPPLTPRLRGGGEGALPTDPSKRLEMHLLLYRFMRPHARAYTLASA